MKEESRMKETKTATPNVDALIDYIKRLTPAQCEKLVKQLPLLKEMCRKVVA